MLKVLWYKVWGRIKKFVYDPNYTRADHEHPLRYWDNH